MTSTTRSCTRWVLHPHAGSIQARGANRPLVPSAQNAKRPNLFAFPTSELGNDVAMSDASSDADLLTPLNFAPERHFHSRLNSNASTFSTSSEMSSLQNSPSSSRECSPPMTSRLAVG